MKIEKIINDLNRIKRELEIVIDDCGEINQEQWLIEKASQNAEVALKEVSNAITKVNRAYRAVQADLLERRLFEWGASEVENATSETE